MRPDEKEFLGNVLKMSAVAGFLHAFVEVPLHEYGHYWAASLFGVRMYVDGQQTIWATNQPIPPLAHALILLSGGLCASVLLAVLYVLMRKPYRYGLLPLIAANLVYAPFDGQSLGFDLGLVALVVVWLLTFGVFLARFLHGTGERGRRPRPWLFGVCASLADEAIFFLPLAPSGKARPGSSRMPSPPTHAM